MEKDTSRVSVVWCGVVGSILHGCVVSGSCTVILIMRSQWYLSMWGWARKITIADLLRALDTVVMHVIELVMHCYVVYHQQ